MSESELNGLEVKTSKQGFPIPLVNGVHLHSVYNPQREAETLAQKFEETIKSKKNILILGLGFGYHVHTILASLQKHQKDFQITVIEPNREIVDYVLENDLIDTRFVQIFSTTNIDELYMSPELIAFLRTQPGVITHPPSFNINDQFYRDFLGYKAPKQLNFLTGICTQDSTRDYLSQFDGNLTFEGVLDELQQTTKPLTEDDMLFIALENMTKNSNAGVQNGELV